MKALKAVVCTLQIENILAVSELKIDYVSA
jgi:hypothetical protein